MYYFVRQIYLKCISIIWSILRLLGKVIIIRLLCSTMIYLSKWYKCEMTIDLLVIANKFSILNSFFFCILTRPIRRGGWVEAFLVTTFDTSLSKIFNTYNSNWLNR